MTPNEIQNIRQTITRLPNSLIKIIRDFLEVFLVLASFIFTLWLSCIVLFIIDIPYWVISRKEFGYVGQKTFDFIMKNTIDKLIKKNQKQTSKKVN